MTAPRASAVIARTADESLEAPRSRGWRIAFAVIVALVAIVAVPLALVMLVASMSGERR